MPNVFSPRDLVSRPDNMDETVPHNAYTLNICMKEFDTQKNIIDKMAAMRTLTFFQACINKNGLFLFYDSAYMSRSTPTTAFDGAI